MVERVRLRALWSVSGAERAAGSALIGNCHPRAKMGRSAALGVFLRDSTIDALAGSRPRASLLSRLCACWRSHDGISRTSCGHPGAFRREKIPLMVEK